MNTNDIMEAMGGVDPALVNEANERPSAMRALRIALPAAACLCLALGIFAAVKLGAKRPDGNITAQQTGKQGTVQEAYASPNKDASAAVLPADPTESSGSFMPFDGNEGAEDPAKQVRTFVTYYEPVGSTEHPLICAGEYALSPTLRAALNEYGAIDEYGNEITYVVRVELYEDVCELVPINCEELPQYVTEEAQRLFNEAGIVTEISKYTGGEGTLWSLQLHITAQQLESFPADPRYGYWIMLRSESFDEYGEPISTTVFGGNN